ncbi:MAG: hypothetical protein GX128_06545 [Bacteroidales bacterium]|nr:hypothetical protein [Bacteroidales bacterium]
MEKKKIIGMIVGAAAFLIAYFAVQQVLFKPPTFDKQMIQIASELNKSCPIMVDAETQLDNTVALPDNTFQYNYTLVSMERATLDISELENYLQPIILNNIKTNPDLKTFRDNDVIMAYNYKDKNGEHLFKLTFKPEIYK